MVQKDTSNKTTITNKHGTFRKETSTTLPLRKGTSSSSFKSLGIFTSHDGVPMGIPGILPSISPSIKKGQFALQRLLGRPKAETIGNWQKSDECSLLLGLVVYKSMGPPMRFWLRGVFKPFRAAERS